MIESTIPEIDVAELMQRVRVEAGKIAERRIDVTSQLGPPVLPALRMLPPPPAPVSIRPVNFKRDRLDAQLGRAREDNQVPRWIPKFLRGLFRKQSSFNRELLAAVTSLVKTNSELTNRVRELANALEAQSRWLNRLADRETAGAKWMRAVQQQLGIRSAGDAEAEDPITKVEGEILNLRGELNTIAAQSTSPEHLRSLVEQLGLQINQLTIDVRQATSGALLAQRSAEFLAAKRSELEQRLLQVEERQARDVASLQSVLSAGSVAPPQE